jgi:hypothetical protein
MGSVIQHKSAESNTQNVSVTLDSPVAEGNLLVAVVSYTGFISISEFDDNLVVGPSAPSYSLLDSVAASFNITAGYGLDLLAGGSYTLTVKFSANDGSFKHLHLFELSGYTSVDRGGQSTGATSTPSVQTESETTFANELVLAAFFDTTHSDEPFTPGTGFTVGETTGSGGTLFTEFQTISAVGRPVASASILNTDAVNGLILTFYDSSDPGGDLDGSDNGGGAAPSGPVFLGSVRVLGSAPSGRTNPFLGTVKVISSAPSGVPNPYLGSIAVGSPSGSQSNPDMGEIVVVTDVPVGASDPFLGTVSEGS